MMDILNHSIFEISIIEWIGYMASMLVLVSLMMASLLKLRVINLVGSVIFSLYGFLIGSYPVGIMNLLIVISNIYYLYKIRNITEEFTIMETSVTNKFFNHFVAKNDNQIKQFFPKFKIEKDKSYVAFYTFKNMSIAGVFVAIPYDEDTLKVLLEYVTPEYRDFKIGYYIYGEQKRYFLNKNYQRLLCETDNPVHINYLERMGYGKIKIDGKVMYERIIV